MRRLVRSLAASLRPDPTGPIWPWVAAARSVVPGRPVLAVPSAARVLALAPHPDDEVLAFGGTLNRLARRGADVRVVLLTDGEASIGTGLAEDEIGRRRRTEAAESVRRLGITSELVALGLPDGDLGSAIDDAVGALSDLVAELRPDAVFTTWLGDGHGDHQTAARIAAGLPLGDDVEVWGGDVWTPLPPNQLVPLDEDAVAAKQHAIAAHQTAAAAFDTSAVLALDRYRSVQGLAGAGHAEGFLVTDAATLRRWIADDQ